MQSDFRPVHIYLAPFAATLTSRRWHWKRKWFSAKSKILKYIRKLTVNRLDPQPHTGTVLNIFLFSLTYFSKKNRVTEWGTKNRESKWFFSYSSLGWIVVIFDIGTKRKAIQTFHFLFCLILIHTTPGTKSGAALFFECTIKFKRPFLLNLRFPMLDPPL